MPSWLLPVSVSQPCTHKNSVAYKLQLNLLILKEINRLKGFLFLFSNLLIYSFLMFGKKQFRCMPCMNKVYRDNEASFNRSAAKISKKKIKGLPDEPLVNRSFRSAVGQHGICFCLCSLGDVDTTFFDSLEGRVDFCVLGKCRNQILQLANLDWPMAFVSPP